MCPQMNDALYLMNGTDHLSCLVCQHFFSSSSNSREKIYLTISLNFKSIFQTNLQHTPTFMHELDLLDVNFYAWSIIFLKNVQDVMHNAHKQVKPPLTQKPIRNFNVTLCSD